MVYGGAFENFRAKRGAIPKIEGEGVMQVYVLVCWGGATQDF